MKKNLLFLILLVLISAVSCNNNINEQVNFDDLKIETSETSDKNYQDETTGIRDENMDIEGVAVLDKSKPKSFKETFLFEKNKDLYPKVDGSTALLPLMAHIRKNTLGEELEDAENAASCTKTLARCQVKLRVI